MSGFEGRMPNGVETDDVEEYLAAWRALSRPIEEEFGVHCYGFDPDLAFQRRGTGGGNFTIHRELAEKIVNLIEEVRELRKGEMLDAEGDS